MPEAEIGWIAAIIVGGLAGWLAEMFMKSGTGILMNIILGIVGAALANWLLGLLGVALSGWLGYLIGLCRRLHHHRTLASDQKSSGSLSSPSDVRSIGAHSNKNPPGLSPAVPMAFGSHRKVAAVSDSEQPQFAA